MSQFKGHLVAFVTLGILLHDGNDSLRLLVRQAVNLANQIVALLHCQWLCFKVLGGLGLSLGWFTCSVVWRLGGALSGVRLSCIRLLWLRLRFLLID